MNVFKRISLAAIVVIVMLSSAMVFAKITHTLLVLDMRNDHELPFRFRTTSDNLPVDVTYQQDGLAELHAAGSQQFSSEGLKAALEKIPSKSVVIIDLRRESHGILNGNGVSWYGPQNAANENKTTEQIKVSEARLLTRLKKSRFRWVHEIIEKTDDDYVDKTHQEFMRVQNVKSEQQLAAEYHAGYKRFYVEDFHRADDEDVDQFVRFAKHIPDNTWLYFHCRAGRGRTTSFMAMYDMMRNAKKVSFDDILGRQLAIGGSDLRELPEKHSFKYKYATERLKFLKNFYQYAKENNDDFSTTWRQWLDKKSVKSS